MSVCWSCTQRDTGHCKILYEDEDEHDDMDGFFDFTRDILSAAGAGAGAGAEASSSSTAIVARCEITFCFFFRKKKRVLAFPHG